MSRFKLRPGFLAGIILLLAPLLWFFPVILGGKTLIPADNLFQFQPWAALAGSAGVGTPHNELLSDLVLENYVWKDFLRQAIAQRELPLWNPYLFTGIPFLAAGQHSALYPLSLVFYILPLPLAYGIFTWLQLALAGLGMVLLGRVLRLSWPACLFAGLAYAFSGFFLVSIVFTMIIAAAAWLPWLLAAIETIIRKQEEKGDVAYSPVPYVIAGAVVVGLQALAGHPEILMLTLLAAGFYTLMRLGMLWKLLGRPGRALRLAGWLLVMVLAGAALGGVQLIPLYELVTSNFREGSVSYDQVVGWAWPLRQIITFLIPDFFGNPSHHGWYDAIARGWRMAGPNAFGQPVRDVFWGVKNYAEGGNYLGIMTLLLAAVAVVGKIKNSEFRIRNAESGMQNPEVKAHALRTTNDELRIANYATRNIGVFLTLAVVSLLFAFGTPLYALLFYGVPGYKQLHSAFRWVFPYTLAMAALAGFGFQWVLGAQERGRRLVRRLGWLSLLAGGVALFADLLSMSRPGPFAALGQRVLDSSDLARNVFVNGYAFWSYEWRHVLQFGLAATLAGLWLLLATRHPRPAPRSSPYVSRLTHYASRITQVAAPLLLLLDLWLVFGQFNPAVDPALLDSAPPSVSYLQADDDLWRMTTFEGQGTTKTFNANTPWMVGLQDVRGYDSIIPGQYVRYMEAIEPQGQLLYNRISPFYDPASLDDPLTDLLGVKYVASELTLDAPGWELVYDDELRIYRNDGALPRAFVASRAELAGPDDVFDLARQVDLRDVVVLEAGDGTKSDKLPPLPSGFSQPPAGYQGQMPPDELPAPASPQLRTATISDYGLRQVFVDVNVSDRGWLVLTDAWHPGWKAFIRRFGETGEGMDALGRPVEQELPIFRADGNFRAVYLPEAGQWTIRFVYSPRSVQLGIYVSFLAAISLLLLGGAWAWGRFYREADGEDAAVRTVAKNSVVQMALSLLNRGIDFTFAMLRLRVLAPAGEGSYAFTIAIYGFFEVVVRFGLGTLLTRDVAQDRERAGRYLVNVVALRSLLWLISLPLLGAVAGGYALAGKLTRPEAQAIGIFAIALYFATLADSFTAVFNAYEKMEYPAGIASAIATAKVAIGALVLLPPFNWGFVGLAGVSVLMNVIQAAWLGLALRRHLAPRRERVDWRLQRAMLTESYPLMLNHLLASIFWRIDLWILKPLAGAVSVGIYSAGVKYLDGLNVIPSYFTLAIFPLMSRYAKDSHESLVRAYQVAVRLLLMVALPVALSVTLLAEPLINILGGSAFLPDSAVALSLLIWSIPVGFVNSVTQYVLIAVGQQRFLTRAFVIGVVFNFVANWMFIPRYGFRAAAVVTILSEFSLLIPFYIAVRRHVASLPWLDLLWRPVAATAGMALVAYGLIDQSPWLAVLAGLLVYGLSLLLLGAFRNPEIRRIRQALPGGKRS